METIEGGNYSRKYGILEYRTHKIGFLAKFSFVK